MNCKPNDLAIVINGHCPCAKKNIGAIVRCIDFETTPEGAVWRVDSESSRILLWHGVNDPSPFIFMGKSAVHFDNHLKPIRPEEAKDDMGLYQADLSKVPLTEKSLEEALTKG